MSEAVAYDVEFCARMWRYSGPAGWFFLTVPDEHAPSVTYAWGRAPVMAEVDGRAWKTSAWREKSGRTLLPVPRAIRGSKGDGDEVKVRLRFDAP